MKRALGASSLWRRKIEDGNRVQIDRPL
jgi:hypothetical protein